MVLTITASTTAFAEKLKVGVLATLEGTYTVLGEDGVRGLKTAWATKQVAVRSN